MTGIKEIPLESIRSSYFELFSPRHDDNTLLISHFGNFTDTKISSFLRITEETILEQGCKRQTMRRICSLLVEALQNAFNHSAKDKSGSAHSFLTLENDSSSFIITTGNLISAEDMVNLEQKLNSINRLNENELRKLYIETLCNDNFNQKGGAGLGFLTMAKKVKGKLEYELINVDKQFAYFALSLTISRG